MNALLKPLAQVAEQNEIDAAFMESALFGYARKMAVDTIDNIRASIKAPTQSQREHDARMAAQDAFFADGRRKFGF